MKVFVSYASENRALADRIAVGLAQDGHEVFFDRDRLPAGEQYHARIRRAIGDCDLFVFLVSPFSLEPTSYALTELQFARERWPNPSGRVLPVITSPVPMEKVPAYLSSVTFLEPRGDLVAEVLARIAALARGARRRRIVWLGAAAAALLAAGALAVALVPGKAGPPPCLLSAQLRAAGSGAPAGDYMFLQLSHATGSQDVRLRSSGAVDVAVENLTASDPAWTIRLNSADGVIGGVTLSGCPEAERVVAFGKEFELVLRPR